MMLYEDMNNILERNDMPIHCVATISGLMKYCALHKHELPANVRRQTKSATEFGATKHIIFKQ